MSDIAVNLADPACEPTDSELENLMRSVGRKAARRRELAERRFMASLVEEIARAAARTGSDPFVDPSE